MNKRQVLSGRLVCLSITGLSLALKCNCQRRGAGQVRGVGLPNYARTRVHEIGLSIDDNGQARALVIRQGAAFRCPRKRSPCCLPATASQRLVGFARRPLLQKRLRPRVMGACLAPCWTRDSSHSLHRGFPIANKSCSARININPPEIAGVDISNSPSEFLPNNSNFAPARTTKTSPSSDGRKRRPSLSTGDPLKPLP